jgi:putative type II/III system pilus formation protein
MPSSHRQSGGKGGFLAVAWRRPLTPDTRQSSLVLNCAGRELNRWFTNLVHVPLNSLPPWSALMTGLRSSFPIAALLAAAAFAMPAKAGPGIEVTMNQAKIVKLSRAADTVVVGNPAIADASVQDAETIVLTGKGFGVTNLVILDQDGSPIIDEQVTVVRQDASSVRIYRRSEIQTMSCTPYCESSYKSDSEKAS